MPQYLRMHHQIEILEKFVRTEIGGEAEYHLPVLPLVVTHYARPKLLAKIEGEGILVVQSFDWE